MRILWLCNIILPSVAGMLNLKPSNKEGWLSGICDAVKQKKDFELGVCFPVPREFDGFFETIDGISYYGFWEDTAHPENYDEGLEKSLSDIAENYKPDVVHIFGTEYPHTLAMCRCMHDRLEKVLIGFQGIVEACTEHYLDGVPEYVSERATFRDILRKDSLKEQKVKFSKRAENERKAVCLAKNFTGRTSFDRKFLMEKNPDARYFFMNETLRKEFYEGAWRKENAVPHTVFLSQGNYPLKGLHVMLEALVDVKGKYPDVKIFVAGDKITAHKTLKDKLKISSYGKYLLELIKRNGLSENVVFTGSLEAEGVKELLLKCSLFVCPSSIENSPNSLGEAMLLGTPCIASRVGGIQSLFEEGKDGLMFESLKNDELAACIDKMWSDEDLMLRFSGNASAHARSTHDSDKNYERLKEIYGDIAKCR